MPKWNSIHISGYHMQKSGVTLDAVLAYTLAYGIDLIRATTNSDLDINKFAARLSFDWGIGINHFKEIAKIRAARLLWAKLTAQLNLKEVKCLPLYSHCQTLDTALTEQDDLNNVARTTIEATAAVFGGTQSLNTHTLEETNPFSTPVTPHTQFYLQEETQITKTVDPWAGSYALEKLTVDIAEKAWALIKEVESLGGIHKAIKKGFTPLRFEKHDNSNSRNHAIPDLKKPLFSKEPSTETSQKTPEISLTRNTNTNKVRNSKKVKTALSKLTEATRDGQNNILALAIEAARERATFKEIIDAVK